MIGKAIRGDEQRSREVPATGVQKSYFMLSAAERAILNTALEKYRPGQSDPILVGGRKLLKPALQLMADYSLQIDEIQDNKAVTSYTRWVEAVQVIGENQDVYLTFSPHFKRIWVQVKTQMPDYVAQDPADIVLRSKYALRLYSWRKSTSRPAPNAPRSKKFER